MNNTLSKIKLTLNKFENEFREKNGTKPKLDDIKNIGGAIEQLYKKYSKLKKKSCIINEAENIELVHKLCESVMKQGFFAPKAIALKNSSCEDVNIVIESTPIKPKKRISHIFEGIQKENLSEEPSKAINQNSFSYLAKLDTTKISKFNLSLIKGQSLKSITGTLEKNFGNAFNGNEIKRTENTLINAECVLGENPPLNCIEDSNPIKSPLKEIKKLIHTETINLVANEDSYFTKEASVKSLCTAEDFFLRGPGEYNKKKNMVTKIIAKEVNWNEDKNCFFNCNPEPANITDEEEAKLFEGVEIIKKQKRTPKIVVDVKESASAEVDYTKKHTKKRNLALVEASSSSSDERVCKSAKTSSDCKRRDSKSSVRKKSLDVGELPMEHDMSYDKSKKCNNTIKTKKSKLHNDAAATEFVEKKKKNTGNFRALKLRKFRTASGNNGYRGFGRPKYKSDLSSVINDENHNENIEDLAHNCGVVKPEVDNKLNFLEEKNIFTFEIKEETNNSIFSRIDNSYLSTTITGSLIPNTENLTYYVNLKESLSQMKLGFDEFKSEQEKAIKEILKGNSTLVSFPTGFGKSLCYQLPAFILKKYFNQELNNNSCVEKSQYRQSVVLVISPTISLMYDQLKCLPLCLNGQVLCSNSTAAERSFIFDRLANDQVDILFISPERLYCDHLGEFVRNGNFPPVVLCCVDEIHCVSEWSHNFRFSYITLSDKLTELFGSGLKILGLTATSTVKSRKDICKMFNIYQRVELSKEFNFVINPKTHVTISNTENKDKDLLELLESPSYKNLKSIIIYTMYQSQADKICFLLKRKNITVESYHAGKNIKERQNIQKRFMDNRIRILVATIAFGLGVNKSDVRSVIHYSLPKSLENFVQEIGRSGRDGKPSFCHLFLAKEDYIKQRSFAFNEGMEESSIWRFLLKIFSLNKRDYINKDSGQNSISLSNEFIEREFDLSETQVLTLIKYIQSDKEFNYRLNYQQYFAEYKIRFVTTPIEDLAKSEKVVDCIQKLFYSQRGIFIVDTIRCCDDLKISTNDFHQTLMNLKYKKEIVVEILFKSFLFEYSPMEIQNNDNEVPQKKIQDKEDLILALDYQLETLKKKLCENLRVLENGKVEKIDKLYKLLNEHAFESVKESVKHMNIINKEEFNKTVFDYFNTEIENYFTKDCEKEGGNGEKDLSNYGFVDEELIEKSKLSKTALQIEVKGFVNRHKDVIKNGRAVARIFHGISSPKYPASQWNRNSAWNKYIHINFQELTRLARKVLKECNQH